MEVVPSILSCCGAGFSKMYAMEQWPVWTPPWHSVMQHRRLASASVGSSCQSTCQAIVRLLPECSAAKVHTSRPAADLMCLRPCVKPRRSRLKDGTLALFGEWKMHYLLSASHGVDRRCVIDFGKAVGGHVLECSLNRRKICFHKLQGKHTLRFCEQQFRWVGGLSLRIFAASRSPRPVSDSLCDFLAEYRALSQSWATC